MLATRRRLLLAPPSPLLRRAVGYWRAADYSGAGNLLDGSGNGLHGVMTDAPKHLPYTGLLHAWFPGTAGNQITTPKPGGLVGGGTVEWVATATDGTTTTGNTAADPVVVGGVAVVDKTIRKIELKDGIGGPVVATLDLTDRSTVTEPYAAIIQAGVTWTIARSATGRKLAIVDRPMLVFGTPNRITIADNPLLDFDVADPWTIAVAYRMYTAQVANAGIVSKKAGVTLANVGWVIYTGVGEAITGRCSDGTVERVSSGSTNVGRETLNTWIRDKGAGRFFMFNRANRTDDDADTIAATMANALDMVIGQVGATRADFEFFGLAIFREPLRSIDAPQLGRELGMAA